jgi:RNA polymerase sigma factor (TIGR02999 family)
MGENGAAALQFLLRARERGFWRLSPWGRSSTSLTMPDGSADQARNIDREATPAGPLFAAWRAGDQAALARLLDRFYGDLKRMAGVMLHRERQVSLSSGDLVQEAVLRLIQLREIDYADQAHFLALAARFMRRVLVDHVRAKQRDKRHHQKVELATRFERARAVDLLGLDAALVRLALVDPQRAEIVEMRYFGGMTLADIAHVLRLSEATVKRRWSASRAWLIDAMDNPFVPVSSVA